MTFETVFWKTFNENGSSIKQSKTHAVDFTGRKTLCGTIIPKHVPCVEAEGGGLCECKRCNKAAAKYNY